QGRSRSCCGRGRGDPWLPSRVLLRLSPANPSRELPAMLGEVHADASLPIGDGEGESPALVIVGRSVLGMNGHVHQILAGSQAQGRTGEPHGALSLEAARDAAIEI